VCRRTFLAASKHYTEPAELNVTGTVNHGEETSGASPGP
jgi:hypothetical protein